jgi:hypothetical protein
MSVIDFCLPRPTLDSELDDEADSRFVIGRERQKFLGKEIDALVNINLRDKIKHTKKMRRRQWYRSLRAMNLNRKKKSSDELLARWLRSLMANYEIQISEGKVVLFLCLIRRRRTLLLLFGCDIYARTLWLTLRVASREMR